MSDENVVAPPAPVVPAEPVKTPEIKPAEVKPAVSDPAVKQTPEVVKTPEAKTSEQKPVVPEKYDLKLPKGSTLDAASVEKVASFAKERGLSNEQAQAVLERESETMSSYAGKMETEMKEKPIAWLAEAKADKEIGGDNFKNNAELAKRVVGRFGTEAFKEQLNKTGFGNHPELVRVFTRIGKAMSEDQLIIPGAQSTGKRSHEDVLYDGGSDKDKQ